MDQRRTPKQVHITSQKPYFIISSKSAFIVCSVYTHVEKGFSRGLWYLRAARLNMKVVVTGGVGYGRDGRDEVLFDILFLLICSRFCKIQKTDGRR